MSNLLIDTHIFLWLNDKPEKLSEKALESCADPNNSIYLSLISLREIQIKSQLNKLQTSVPWEMMVETQQEENDLQVLTLSKAHIEQLSQLAMHHRDPFDRMLIAQARTEKMTLVSADRAFESYDIELIW